MVRPYDRKKSSAVSFFRSGRRSLVCARLGSKGKVGVQRGRKTAGCPSFLPTAVGTASSPRRAPRRSRRSGGASLAEVQRKLSAPSGRTRLRSSRAPLSRCREKGCRPLGANRLCGSCTPVNRCRIEKKTIFNRKNLRKPTRTDCLSHLYLL